MRILILGESLDDPRYRGTQRCKPHYDGLTINERPTTQLFLWLIDYAENGIGPVEDLAKASELVREYAKLDPPQHFELVEVVTGDAEPESGGRLLGFDVTEGLYQSILANGLKLEPKRHRRGIEEDPGYASIAPMYELFCRYFNPQLNDNVLFPDRESAEFCLECAANLIDFYEHMFDILQESLVVAGLYLVEPIPG